VVATKDKTIVVGGKGKKGDIEARANQLRAQLAHTDSKFDREKIEERIAKLTGGVAVIRVGAATETEMKYLKLKIEDAVNATKAAIEEGVVSGGGTAFVKVAQALRDRQDNETKKWSDDKAAGYAILVRALDAPLKQIAANAGNEESGAVLQAVRNGSGYDAVADKIVSDMFKAGIIDPVKVTRSGIQNAASAAAILLTTEVAIAEEPKNEPDMPMGGGMPGMGGMM
jgi:chaperonin GroEL